MELSPALIISPSITSIQYKVERDKRYLPYIELNLEKHELNHFEDNRNTILELFWSLTSEHEMARETKIQSIYYFISK